MQMGGLIGEIELTGPALAALWPGLWLGQWVHVGKGTAFRTRRLSARSDRLSARRGHRKLVDPDRGAMARQTHAP